MAISRNQAQDARKALLLQQLVAENPQAVDMYNGGNMQQTLLDSNSPFALVGRGIDKVSDAVLPTPDGTTAREKLAQTGQDLSSIFGSLLRNRSGSPFVVGDVMSQQGTRDLGMAEDSTALQSSIDADKERLIKRTQKGGLTGQEAQNKLDVINERQARLNRAVENKQPAIEARTESANTFLESVGADPVSTTPLEEKRKEEKEVNDQAGTTGGDSPDQSNWFDTLNSKVDIMAMGAAMLAGSDSGRSTLGNLGVALQSGIASRRGQDKEADAKKRADAMLAIQLLSAQNKGALTQPQRVKALESELRVYGADGDNVNTIANYLDSHPIMSRNLAMLDPKTRETYLTKFVNVGQGWAGSELDEDNILKAGEKAFKHIQGK
jgi:hypothetical protein